MSDVVADPREITIDWLDAVLKRAGAIERGRVVAFDVDARKETWSNSARIQPRYSSDATGERPASLFLKICPFAEFGQSEVDYYRRDYVGFTDVPLVRCFDAQHDPKRRAYHVLLEDLSSTHTNCWEHAVTTEFVVAIADSVARLHVKRWNGAALAEIGEHLPGKPELEHYFGHIASGLEPLLAIGGDDVKPEWRPLLREIFDRHPNLMLARMHEPRGICLVHGDVNPGNMLAPRGGTGRIYLIDRQPFDWSLRVWLGVSDLAYLMCSFWPEDVRRKFETTMLDRYHAALVGLGIDDYAWDELLADYRLCVVQAVYVAVEWCVLEKDQERMRWLWSRELRRAMSAFEDLRCQALWAG